MDGYFRLNQNIGVNLRGSVKYVKILRENDEMIP